jgi:colicin import membrane protein
MADEPDGMHEVFQGGARVALTAAGLIAERLMRAREQAQRDAQAASEHEARELQTRLDAERTAARASLAPVAGDDWWQRAGVDDVARAWETAKAWEDVDADARRITDRMREQLHDRYAIEVDYLDADPAAVRDALTRREDDLRRAAQERDTARLQDDEAALLMVGADRADRDREPGEAAAKGDRGDTVYDSAERREQLAASLEGRADEETIEARVVADTSQGAPAHEAVANGPRRAPAARRSRGSSGPARAPGKSERGR